MMTFWQIAGIIAVTITVLFGTSGLLLFLRSMDSVRREKRRPQLKEIP